MVPRDLLLHERAPADALAENSRNCDVQNDQNKHWDYPAGLAADVLKRRARIEKRADDAAERADRLRRLRNSGSRCGHGVPSEANGFAISHYVRPDEKFLCARV